MAQKKVFSSVIAVLILISLASGLQEKRGLNVGEFYSGFKLVKQEYIPEIEAQAYLFHHEKSGARLVKLENDDTNNVFSITFRTLPQDDTGVAHIMEHSVLCGSERFPVKSPFDIMRKGSLRTFLNAMTSSDVTMYPIASKNKKDFYNLMTVYLDGVFHPVLLKDERILMQEGWRYEWDPLNEKLRYNGVVYNEMKGAMSSPESALRYAVSQELLPDTIYGNNSGGDPLSIPSLTQEMFIDFHKTYYHPSNAYIYLYGDIDVCEQLKYISEEYLNEFEKRENHFNNPRQIRFTERRQVTRPYPGGTDGKESQDYLSYHFLMKEIEDNVEMTALSLLEEYLMGMSASPLKKKMEAKGLGTLFYSSFYPSAYPVMSFVAVGGERANEGEFTALIDDTLKELAEQGLEESLLTSLINRLEFRLREPSARFSKGLGYMFQINRSWINTGEPFESLKYEKVIERLRNDRSIWKDLIKKHFIQNDHVLSLTMIPDPGMNQRLAAIEKERLAEVQASLTKDDLQAIIQKNEALKAYQETPDSEEALSRVPLLSLSDIEPVVAVPDGKKKTLQGRSVLTYEDHTNGIYYWELYFDISDLDKKSLQSAVLLSRLLGRLGAGEDDYETLSTKISTHLGGLDFGISQLADAREPALWKAHAVTSLRVLAREADTAVGLLSTILTETDFSDEKRLKILLENEKAQMERSLLNDGLGLAIARARAGLGGAHLFDEITSGYDYYLFVRETEEAFRNDPAQVQAKLKQIYDVIFISERAVIGLITEKELINAGLKQTKKIISILPHSNRGITPSFKAPKLAEYSPHEGFASPSRVNFVAQVADFKKEGQDYNGSLLAAATIVRNNYLWQSLRVRGGAYGGGMSAYGNGTMLMYSFRDPHIAETLQIFEETEDYLARFQPSIKEMELYLIGTIANLDLPDAPLSRGRYYFTKVLTGGDLQEINRIRKEVLSTTPEKIRSYAPLFRKMIQQGIYSVYGNEKQVKDAEGEALKKVIKVN